MHPAVARRKGGAIPCPLAHSVLLPGRVAHSVPTIIYKRLLITHTYTYVHIIPLVLDDMMAMHSRVRTLVCLHIAIPNPKYQFRRD